MTGQWKYNALKGAPQRIRPEAHWFQETRPPYRVSGDPYGRVDGSLWFSLQFKPARVEQLYQSLGKLIDEGACIAPASRKAVKYALDLGKFDTIGTDIYVPVPAFSLLERLSDEGAIEITDAGLAVEGEIQDRPEFKVCSWDAEQPAKSIPMRGPIPPGGPVIIATIDDGIGIANHRFRESEDKTRIKHFLDLALIAPKVNGGVDELLGRSWNGADINKLLGQDEEQVYRALGLIYPARDLRQPLRAGLTHGTHVLDLAAGYDWRTETEREKAASRPIIAVQLPTQVAENRSDTWLPQCLKRALDWILVKADELSANISKEFGYVTPDGQPSRLPLVVNGSFASMAGPQDGYSDVERRITQFIKTYRGDGPDDLCTFVLAAGNSLQLRAAAQMDILPGKSEEILLRVLPDDKTPNFVQIWLPKVGGHPQQPQVRVSLVPPRDAPVKEQPAVEWKIGKDPAARLDAAVEWDLGGHVGARIYHQCLPRPGGSRECITVATRPTADDQESEPVVLVPSGSWKIRIKNISNHELRSIDLRVHRDDPGMFSRSGARQSYFDDPEYVMFDPGSGRIINDERRDNDKRQNAELRERGHWTRVTRQGTLSSYAYAKGVLAVGGYSRSDGEPATYSSSGRCPNDCANGADLAAVSKESPALAGSSGSDVHYRTSDEAGNPLDAPDLAAVSEESPALTGVLAAGTYSGSAAVLSGTSVAAPQITRALADQIATRAIAKEIWGTEPKAAGAAEKLKAAVAADEAPQSIIPGREHYNRHRPLRDGVGRLPFTFRPSYPRRTGD